MRNSLAAIYSLPEGGTQCEKEAQHTQDSSVRITHGSVLVTGGSGFIGSHTVDALVSNNVNTWVLDDLSTGLRANLAKHKQNPLLHYVKGSVCNPKLVGKLTRNVDAVIHLAAVVSPFVSVKQPTVTNNVNVAGTLTLLNACRDDEVKRIVFASSSSVYGDTGNCRRIPEFEQTNPVTPYGASKLAGEKYCRAFSSTYGVSTVSLRYFNVYGERQRNNPYSGVIAIFANSLRNSKRATIFGTGRQTRDFVHVSDVATANLAALEFPGKGDEFNIGTGMATSINHLHALIAKTVGITHIKPIRKAERVGDIRDSCADISRATKILKFRPQVKLEDGLSRLAKWLDPR